LSNIDELLRGSIDMHIHHGPDAGASPEPRLNALQGALQAREAGMRAIVLKCHECPTANIAYIVNQVVPDIAVIGSICMNREVGGLNPYALEYSANLGAKMVWMPTFSAKHHEDTEESITVLNNEGKLLPVVLDILDIIKKHDIVLATGHLSVAEIFILVDEAKSRGLTKIIITHPLGGWHQDYFSLEEQRQMARKGAYLEHCYGSVFERWFEPERIVEAVREVGAEHCIMSTDLGQDHNPAPTEGMRTAIASMIKCGLTEDEVVRMVKVNPARLLGLD
jgi:predicted TIM-barrel fold metal-dependent hydrolase